MVWEYCTILGRREWYLVDTYHSQMKLVCKFMKLATNHLQVFCSIYSITWVIICSKHSSNGVYHNKPDVALNEKFW